MEDNTLLYDLAHAAQRKAARARRRKARGTPSRAVDPAELRLSPTQRAGRDAEDRACQYLLDRGLIVLGRNLRGKTGEIDLVANDGGVLACIAVRHRD